MKAEIIIIENCFLYAQLWATKEQEERCGRVKMKEKMNEQEISLLYARR